MLTTVLQERKEQAVIATPRHGVAVLRGVLVQPGAL